MPYGSSNASTTKPAWALSFQLVLSVHETHCLSVLVPAHDCVSLSLGTLAQAYLTAQRKLRKHTDDQPGRSAHRPRPAGTALFAAPRRRFACVTCCCTFVNAGGGGRGQQIKQRCQLWLQCLRGKGLGFRVSRKLFCDGDGCSQVIATPLKVKTFR